MAQVAEEPVDAICDLSKSDWYCTHRSSLVVGRWSVVVGPFSNGNEMV
jgi:hypothetical protein